MRDRKKDPAVAPSDGGRSAGFLRSRLAWLIRLATVIMTLGCLSGLITVLAVGGVVAGLLGLFGVGLLVLMGIPVAGFTRNQWRATSRALQFARSVDDVAAIKRSDAAAFTQPITALRHQVGHDKAALPAPPDPTPRLPRQTGPGIWTATSWVGAAATPRTQVRRRTEPRRRTAPHRAGPSHQDNGRSGGGSRNFWDSLAEDEQRELVAAADWVVFDAETVLWRRGEPAEHVMVIRSGWTKICDERHVPERIIAFRGPGELVGERAALRRTTRSATVVAVEAVRALRISTERFSAFVKAHLHVLDVIEGQVYERMSAGPPTSTTAWSGQNGSILLFDIAAFGAHTRTEDDRRVVRRVMYAAVRGSCERAGVPWSECHREDRGDGILLVLPPTTPTGLVVDPMLTYLAAELRTHNRRAGDGVRLQLRMALHVGPVRSDEDGVTGDAIIYTARLLAAPGLKRQFREAAADVGFITSDFVYDTFIRHGLAGIDPTEYRRVTFRAKETYVKAWIRFANPERQERSA
jgi:CRP-like cAMP-binding protein